MDEDHEALGDDPAAAFEALRAEVAALRASFGDGRAAPDYAPTLGKMAASLAKIEAHPAIQLTPDAFAYQVRQARDAAQQQVSRDMSAAIQRVDAAGADWSAWPSGSAQGGNRWRHECSYWPSATWVRASARTASAKSSKRFRL